MGAGPTRPYSTPTEAKIVGVTAECHSPHLQAPNQPPFIQPHEWQHILQVCSVMGQAISCPNECSPPGIAHRVAQQLAPLYPHLHFEGFEVFIKQPEACGGPKDYWELQLTIRAVPGMGAGGLAQIQVQVPPGAAPGSMMQVAHNGAMIQCVVPPGAAPGSTFAMQVPAPAPSTFSVIVPPGIGPGMMMGATDPRTGAQIQVALPPGAQPGQTIQVPIPGAAPMAMAAPAADEMTGRLSVPVATVIS